jgi:hypothetical protein
MDVSECIFESLVKKQKQKQKHTVFGSSNIQL